jgi:endoglucanase
MSSKNLKRSLAAVAAVAMLAGVVALPAGNIDKVSAGEVLGETSFEYKALPWHTCESSPAKQNFELVDGTLHVMILKAQGADKEKWDLQVRHRNLNFKAGHTYTVSFKAKGKRAGMELCSKISNIKGDEEYCVCFGDKLEMGQGPAMGGQWGKALKLTTDWQTVTGTFTPTQDLEACEWAFHYAKGTQYEGNAEDGDEIWFDDMSIICETCSECDADPNNHYGAISRDFSGLKNNYISVNQVGYYPNRKKIAVLGDNAGDITHDASKISLSGAVDFEVIDASSGTSVYKGTSSAPTKDADSADTVCKLDFSEVKTPGTYYIKAGEYRSFEFKINEDLYEEKDHNLLTNAMNYFYQNRSGIDIEEKYITSGETSKLAHKGGHKTDTASVQKIWKNEYASQEEATGTYASSKITANGGWYDAGDHGKYVVNGGISIWTLQNMYERAVLVDESKKFDDGSGTVVVPEAGNKIPDVLDEAAVELDWIAEMKVADDEPTWGKKAAGLYYHKLHDHKWTGLATKPWDYETEWKTVRIVKPPTFAATLNYAACAAQAARLWEPFDSSKAATYLSSAIDAYKAYQKWYYPADTTKTKHPDLGCDCSKEEINEESLYAPMWQAKGGGPYGDDNVLDDAYWAACEIFVSASKMGDSSAADFQKELESYKDAYKVTTRITGGENKDGSLTTFNWGNTASAGSLSLALHKDLLSDANAKTVEDSILEAADEYIKTEDKQGYGIPYLFDGEAYNDPNNLDPSIMIKGYEWGSNSMVINNAIVMAYAYDQTGDGKYIDGVTQAMDYLLGTNPLSFSFVSGYGSYRLHNPHHRYWSEELDKTLPAAPDGVLSGGPNAGLQDPYVRALGFVPGNTDNPSQRCYVDSIEAWSTNEVTINWNSPLAWIASFLEDNGNATGPNPGTKTSPSPKESPSPAESPSPDVKDSPSPSPKESPSPDVKDSPSADVKESPSNDNPGQTLLGDVDCSGNIDVTDLTTLAVALVDKKELTGQSKLNADVTQDGKVDLTDLATLKQYLSKKITKF